MSAASTSRPRRDPFLEEAVLVIDSREQRPYAFGPEVQVQRKALPVGDYSVVGLEARAVVERKALGDLFGVIGHDRERFERELEKLGKLDFAALVVEGSFADLQAGPRTWVAGHQPMSASSILGTLAAWSVRYRIGVWLAGSWVGGREITYRLLRHAWRYLGPGRHSCAAGAPGKAGKPEPGT